MMWKFLGIGLVGSLTLSLSAAAQDIETTSFMGETPSVDEIISALQPNELSRGLCRVGVDPDCSDIEADQPELKSVALDIKFSFDSAQLTPQAQSTLDQLGLALGSAQLGGYKFLVEGHTDAKGGEGYNQSLSERRAYAVRDYLASSHGISPSKLFVVGKGESSPLFGDDPMHGDNRRVEIVNIGQ